MSGDVPRNFLNSNPVCASNALNSSGWINIFHWAEGLARSRRARWKHGLYSEEVNAQRKLVRELLQSSRELLSRGQIVEGWDNWDKLAMLEQIGFQCLIVL
jgi:hypothetical protein